MQRNARLGFHTYAIKVSTLVAESGVMYVDADSVTVSNGALMLSAEMPSLEAMEAMEAMDAEEEGHPLPEAGAVELPPVFVFAPGHWYSVMMVDDELKPFFLYEAGE
jgi:hypothetical protein